MATLRNDTYRQDFFEYVNHDWLTDESITIPPEYPRWGSFTKLADDSLKNQIKLLKEVVDGNSYTADEKKLAQVWKASMTRFENWEAGKGDYRCILSEFANLDSHLKVGADESTWGKGLAKYFSRCQQIGLRYPFSFDKGANLEDPENVILDFSPSGLSLPSRDYYLEEKFQKERDMWKVHLGKVHELIGKDVLAEDFADRVFNFERKLAMIMMKRAQSRLYDQYYTVTTLDDMIKNINSIKHLKDKEENYEGSDSLFEGTDKDVLTSKEWKVNKEYLPKIHTFLNDMYEHLGLRELMSTNYKANYKTEGMSEEESMAAQFRLTAFDGDYLRRIFYLLLNADNHQDVVCYLQYRIIRFSSGFCTKDLNEEHFDFYSRKLHGQEEQKSHEKRSMGLVNAWLGELMGKVYVSKYFSEEDKVNVENMIEDVLGIMADSLRTNDWLTAETKAKGAQKLEKFVVKIGYPSKWKNYDALKFADGDDLFQMETKVNAFEYEKEFAEKLNTPKDKTKWEMTPQTVNAYFHPLNNEIVFPAAILQPPFYAKTLDQVDFDMETTERTPEMLAAINFGGIGAVIAHEITHGYDDQGRKFDADGKLNNWWSDEDLKLFNAKTEVMHGQAEKYVFVDPADKTPHKMNGKLTMGENLADLGGMSLACKAMLSRFGNHSQRQLFLQLFFKSWANVWKIKQTPAYSVQQLATDPHAPAPFRGNLVKNNDYFYEAYPVREGDPMYLKESERVSMW
mmetsp:Transcript_26901/g.32574  ORF Transcript_26901/g.32574 Transcript_26901/m.32574 type:complete len:738 (+) Transcript_26901:110-2323(+)